MKKIVFSENLNWFTRFIFKLFKKPIISKIQLKDLVDYTKILDSINRDDKSYLEEINAKS